MNISGFYMMNPNLYSLFQRAAGSRRPISYCSQQGCHVPGHVAGEVKHLPGNGMGKAKTVRVQRLPSDKCHGAGIVQEVSDQGMADMLHMDADLMGSPRFKVDESQRQRGITRGDTAKA